jgi:hypothetical protein
VVLRYVYSERGGWGCHRVAAKLSTFDMLEKKLAEENRDWFAMACEVAPCQIFACWPAAANTWASCTYKPATGMPACSRTWPPHEQQQWHTGEAQECDQHEAILIGRNGCLLFEMLLHEHLYLRFP